MPEPRETSPPPDWRRRLVRLEVPRRLLLVGLLSATSALGAALLAPPAASQVPGPERLGQPAQATIRADRDYDVVDEEATARRRDEAARAEPPVYDEDQQADDEAAARVHAAFALMRAEEVALAEQQGGVAAAELARRHASQRDAFVARLQQVVRDDDFAALVAARFSEPVERELAALTAKGLAGLVVGELPLLPAEQQPFLVRPTGPGDAGHERLVVDRALVRDVATSRDEVGRAAAARLAGLPAALRAALTRLATAAVRPTLVHDQAETERRRAEAAARVRPVVIPVKRGERIVTEGERIEPRHLPVLEAVRAHRRLADRTGARLGGGALLALLVTLLWVVAGCAVPGFRPSARDAVLLAVLFAGTLALAVGGQGLVDLAAERLTFLPRAALEALLPLAAGAVVARQVLTPGAALVLALGGGLAAGLVAGPSLALALQAVLASVAAVGLGAPSGRPRGVWRSGLAAGLAGAAAALGLGLLDGRSPAEAALVAAGALAGGLVLVPPLAGLALGLAGRLLGHVTSHRLRQLANLNHPALKELIVQAPGTYHHSILMGTMVEAAAGAIGADALLARVGAYYHDVGKIRNPLLFAENQRGDNEHDELPPQRSAQAVKRHVTDGLELARRWRLPRSVVDLMQQHHGTRRIDYFWAKHQKAVEAGEASPIDEAEFRYPGPRPSSREAALVMIADVCEASARGLTRPDAAALQALVDQRLAELVEEGQLEECDLTHREVAVVAEAVAAALAEVYGRPERPAPPGTPPPRPHVQLVTGP